MRDASSLEKILVLDFGAQYAHLICRRIRELGVYAELVPHNISPSDIKKRKAIGLVLSGGPKSVYSRNAPLPDSRIYALGIPILGICYGLQAMVHQKGGNVRRADRREYGKSEIRLDSSSMLFQGIESSTVCWMSHGDAAETLPNGFHSIASSANSPFAAIACDKLYAVQFHPEVTHTERGKAILENYVYRICGGVKNWTTESMIDDMIAEIIAKVGKHERVLCALSGGIDSATTAVILEKAIGKRLFCVFVDHGLLRKGEKQRIESTFRPSLGVNLIIQDESEIFLRRLKGVKDPERKRKVIGREFIRAFAKVSRKLGRIEYLAQGTLYTDIIESAAGASNHESKIKSHHNVGGLPKRLGFKLVEPLKDLYKDEVRRVASVLGLPRDVVETHPFPGPGLGVRIIGSVTKEKLEICRESSQIVEEEIFVAGLQKQVWQAFAFVGDDLATGVLGDERNVGHIVTLRIVESRDAMTADWSRISYPILEKISNRITNEVPGVTWVTYAISSKPPSTIEPQ
ncbi:MAG: glutamine-hydrolyzing GMP synthase [Nitrososphaerales archaeon]